MAAVCFPDRMVVSQIYPSRLGWSAWVSGLACGTTVALLSWPGGAAGSPAVRVGAVLLAAVAGALWQGGALWRWLLLPAAGALAVAGPWAAWSVPAAAGAGRRGPDRGVPQ